MQAPEFSGIQVSEQVVAMGEGTVPVVNVKAYLSRKGGKRKFSAGRIALGPVAMAMAKKEGGQLVLNVEGGGRTLTIPIDDADEDAARLFADDLTRYGKSIGASGTRAQSPDATETELPPDAPSSPAASAPPISPAPQTTPAPPISRAEAQLAKAKKRAQEGIRDSLEPGERLEVVILGEWSQVLAATDRRAFIYKGGITSGSFFSKQLNTWDYRNISGVELRKNMTIQTVILQVPGVAPVTKTGRMDKGPNSSWEAPNAIMVPGSTDLSQQISEIRRLIAQFHQPATVATPPVTPQEPDPIEQVKRLAELRDQGILTEEEFQTKKRELLGL